MSIFLLAAFLLSLLHVRLSRCSCVVFLFLFLVVEHAVFFCRLCCCRPVLSVSPDVALGRTYVSLVSPFLQ